MATLSNRKCNSFEAFVCLFLGKHKVLEQDVPHEEFERQVGNELSLRCRSVRRRVNFFDVGLMFGVAGLSLASGVVRFDVGLT